MVVDREGTADGAAAREWVERSDYNSCEAHDVFEAIEEIADFTMAFRPEVIVLDADCCEEEAEVVKETLDAIHTSEVPVLAVPDAGIHTTGGGRFDIAPAELPEQLEILITHA
ncbi:MAG TPA: hypothetical protein VL501_00760 [Pyrinomonadaceae bacterium]|nr:hypothetical protein [Pyrinomonadaceae bacterium]